MGLLDVFRPRWRHSDPDKRLSAVRQTSDPTELSRIAKLTSDERVARLAIRKIEKVNKTLLSDIAENAHSAIGREQAEKAMGTADLLEAVKRGDVVEIDRLIGGGLDVNAENFRGENALGYAEEFGTEELAAHLRSKGAQWSRIIRAILDGTVRQVSAAVDEDTNLEQRGPWNQTALILAAKQNQPELVTMLVNHGANPNATFKPGSRDALDVALHNSHQEVIKVLLPYFPNKGVMAYRRGGF
jgi:hypothetical protein